MKILIVEDQEEIQDIYSVFLSSDRFDLQITDRLVQAKAWLEEQDFSLVLTDIFMPEGNGLPLIKLARSKNVPVICITGFLDAYKDLIPDDVPILRKPFDSQTFMEAIENALNIKQ